MNVICGDNLETLKKLRDSDEKFDLVELDGPYMAGLEGWDCLTEAEYIQHYAERLSIVRELLQPWGVVFVFGYPEGIAEIKAWAHQTNTLFCRRWLHWYNNNAAHAARRIQVVIVFTKHDPSLLPQFRAWLKSARKNKGMSLREARLAAGVNVELLDNPRASSGGYFWYEANCSDIPTIADYRGIKRAFNAPDKFDVLPMLTFEGVTNLDFMTVPVEKAEHLNDNGLRSKPIQLYVNLFKSTVPPTKKRKALILYGGSGNAAIASEALGYETTLIEQSRERCEAIEQRAQPEVDKLKSKLSQQSFLEMIDSVSQAPLFTEAQL